MAGTLYPVLLSLLFLFDIKLCCSRNASLDFFLSSRSMRLPFESESEELSNQKQYVVRLNAKLLAQERERLEKNFQQLSFNYTNDHRRSRIEKENFIDSPGKSIGSHLRKISNEELCVPTMQAIYDTLPSDDAQDDSQEILNEISTKLSKKVIEYVSLLESNKLLIENLHATQSYEYNFMHSVCCQIFPETLNYNEHFGTEVTLEKGCLSFFTYSIFPSGMFIGESLTPTFKENLKQLPSLVWQYYISSIGAHFEYPGYNLGFKEKVCNSKTDRHRVIYQESLKSKIKHVIMVVDQGYSLSKLQFDTAKSVAKHILSLLSSHDKVVAFGLAADLQFSQGNGCNGPSMLHATTETKLLLARFFDGLTRKPNITNHVLGFRKVYDIIRKIEASNHSAKNEFLIAYISRGLLSSLVDAKQVLEIIADESLIKTHIVINTYALIDDEKPVMYEKEFLKDVAAQDFRKFNIFARKNQEAKKGVMVSINSTDDVSSAVGDIFSAFPNHSSMKSRFSLPYFDTLSKGMIVSLTQQVFHRQKVAGITGIDISLTDITEDISYFPNSDEKYIFLLDETGLALTHPSFSHPTYANEHHIHTYIWHLEDKPGFLTIYKAILREPSGERVLPLKIPSDTSKKKHEEKIAVYQWKKVEGTPYILCLVLIEPARVKKVLKPNIVSDSVNFSYHRLDLLPAASTCRHMKQLSSLGTTALFLSASCFASPYKYLMEEESKQSVQNYVTYLKDTTKLIANPGLKPEIRSEVLALSQITPAWKSAAHENGFSNYIVRRFIATYSGVFQMYPATMIDKSYDATRRDWYMRALEHPGKIILTAPYLDIGGAGYVITLSHTIYEGKPAALHNTCDNVVAVMGMDFTFGYFHKFLQDKIPVCKQDQITCFFLDDKGYLISHPDLIEPAGRGPVEQQHITHKEPMVANDLLNHKEFVSKKMCNSYSDRTIQRFYQLNTSLDTVLTNLVHGEQCTKYQVMAIHGTNIFLGIVNRTCDGITAFCPCSMTDRLCLNCHRMEPTECECPCECPLKMSLCSGQLIDESNRYPTCPHFPEEPNLPFFNVNILEKLQPCYEHHCSLRTDISDCFGILSCEWCQLESDGVSPLQNKFCTDQRKCFGGVLGAKTPYADEIIEGLPEGEFLVIKSTPVGPVAGGFMLFFLVSAVGVYCYRNHVRRDNIMHYSNASPETNFRMTQLNNEPDEMEHYQEPINTAPPVCPLRIRMENVVSPYRVPTNYRRPPGGDSDHGYSTMTPHEDSELAPYFEPLLIGKDRLVAPSSQQSFSSGSRASSPMSCQMSSPSVSKMDGIVPIRKDFVPQTVLPSDVHGKGASYVLAQVQVHSSCKD